MTDQSFKIKNGLIVNSSLFVVDTAANLVSVANAISIGSGSPGIINSTAWSGTANSTFFVGAVSAANVVSNAQLSANLANYASLGQLAANVATITSTKNQTLSYGPTTNWDCSQGIMATVTLTGATIMAAPTNIANGSLVLVIKQDAVGSRHVTSWNAIFKWPGGITPTLSTTANAKDLFSFVYDGTFLYGSYVTGLA